MKTKPNDSVSQMFLRQVGKNDFRAATPKDLQQGDYISHHIGLTKRELFAIKALQGLLANSNSQGGDDYYVRGAVYFADALIEELNKQSND